MKKTYIGFLCFVLFMLSCSKLVSTSNQEVDFPLVRASTLSVGENIRKLAIVKGWAVVQIPGKHLALDTNTGQKLWSVENFSEDEDSQFQIEDDSLLAVNYESIKLMNRSGDQKTINLNSMHGDIIRLIGASHNYLYIIRGPLWILQAYDSAKNSMLWEMPVGRGQVDAYYDDESGITYVVTPNSVDAIENSTGKLIWQEEASTKQSSFANGILYRSEQLDNSSTYRFSALETRDRRELWKQEHSLDTGNEVYQLSIVGDLIIVSTRYGYLALHKDTGDQVWRSQTVNDIFNNQPVEYDGILYARGSSGKNYAISLENGNIIGLYAIENNPPSESRYDASQSIYRIEDGIAVSTSNEIIIFRQK